MEPAGSFTLDGLEYLSESSPNEKQVVDYISRHKLKGEKLVESYGDSYTDNGRISSSTGVPTVLGWVFHEIQWRGSDVLVEERTEKIGSYEDGLVDLQKELDLTISNIKEMDCVRQQIDENNNEVQSLNPQRLMVMNNDLRHLLLFPV